MPLKNDNRIEIKVVMITKIVLQTSLKRLRLWKRDPGGVGWGRNPDPSGYEFTVRELLCCLFLDEGEEGLAVDLVCTNKMDYDCGVGFV
ncbi:hypothetical protein L484_007162 [Morus notabilis]|uniref:Uncharacterized protein n=1 Tax=Morus notabilis TaxID=981085 RepID=W9RZE2_9ROSA|nr:hypothetical protein L484_007162 [Morus notabilis]